MVKLNEILKRWTPRNKQHVHVEEERDSKSDTKKDISIKGLDFAKGLEKTDGSIDLYKSILSDFYEDARESIISIRNCIDTNNADLYASHIHGLKSTLLFIGADILAEWAHELELAGDRADMDFIKENNSRFIISLQTLMNNIINYFNQ
jgi:HPt (histidine-containing phosphotransfer) domain-containing protein